MSRQIALGADVGGTKIAIVAVDLLDGSVLMRDEIPTLRQRGGQDTLDRFKTLISKMHSQLQAQDIQPVGLGIGVPELIDNAGTIKSNWNFDWDERDIVSELSNFGPVQLESDVRAVALTEAEFGHGRTYPSFIFVNVGSGLSYCFCNDGKIHRGANGYAIHFGSSDLMTLCSACGVPSSFNLEALASGRGLSETYQARTGQYIETRELTREDATRQEKELLDQAAHALASYLGQLINIFDPHALIIGGGLGRSQPFFSMLQNHTRPYIWAKDCQDIPITTSTFPNDGTAIGAALLLRKRTVDP